MKSMQSNKEDWEKLNKFFSNLTKAYTYSNLCKFTRVVGRVKEIVNNEPDFQIINFSINSEFINEFFTIKNNLEKYSLNIHSEIISNIDDPYFRQMKGLTEVVYKLNPKDANSKGSIEDMVNNVIVDSHLRKDYLELINKLQNDKPSKNLESILSDELWSWMDSYSYEEVKNIERTIYNSPKELGELCYNKSPYVSFDYSNRKKTEKDFFHEIAHIIDNSVKGDPKGYISVSGSEYADDFYDNLIKDVNNYIDNYNQIHGCNLSRDEIKEAISRELALKENGHMSDIFAAVTKDKYKGTEGHDKGYWNYNIITGKPSKKVLNKEAFADFTVSTLMGGSEEQKRLEQYFPNSFRIYRDMLREEGLK